MVNVSHCASMYGVKKKLLEVTLVGAGQDLYIRHNYCYRVGRPNKSNSSDADVYAFSDDTTCSVSACVQYNALIST